MVLDKWVQPISDELPHISVVQGENEGKTPFAHALLIDDLLIDTGVGGRRMRKVSKKLDIDRVFLSHWHEDHVSGNSYIKDTPFFSHSLDKAPIENVELFYKLYAVDDKDLLPQFRMYIDSLQVENTPIAGIFEDNDIFQTSHHTIQVVHTPGHTQGHCCFFEPEAKVLFLGDIDLSSFGPWYGTLDASLVDFESSIDKLINLRAEYAISSHKGLSIGSKHIKKKLEAYKRTLTERDVRIQAAIPKNGATLPDLEGQRLIYPKYTSFRPYFILAESIMIKQHLERLVQKNCLKKSATGVFRKI